MNWNVYLGQREHAPLLLSSGVWVCVFINKIV